VHGSYKRFTKVAEVHALPFAQSASGFRERLPSRCVWIVPAVMRRTQKQQFDVPAGRPRAENARCDDSRFIQYEHITGAQVLRQIAKRAVFDCAVPQHEQTRCIARHRGLLRDQAFRKREIVSCG
jgi:hypothetical protein